MFGSTGIGIAPTYETANQVAIYVFEGTITSSPGPISNDFKDRISASRPLATPIQYLESQNSANSCSNFVTFSPSTNHPEFIVS